MGQKPSVEDLVLQNEVKLFADDVPEEASRAAVAGASAPVVEAMPRFLGNETLRLIFFGGKGGVGKTTCAAATAMHLANAHRDDKYLLVSTDPAHSLQDIFYGITAPRNLTVIELNAEKCLQDFKVKYKQTLRKMILHGTFLDGEDADQFLNLSLPGIDEMMAFFEIIRWMEEGEYRSIIVDTAPDGHTLRLLAMPNLLRSWLEAGDAMMAKHHYLKKVFGHSQQHDELDEFLDEWRQAADRIEELLSDVGRCLFVPVMIAEALCVNETVSLAHSLQKLQVPFSEIVINKILSVSDCPFCSHLYSLQEDELRNLYRQLANYALWELPFYPEVTLNQEQLRDFWHKSWRSQAAAFSADHQRTATGDAYFKCHPLVDHPLPLPHPETELLLFAGKGGVGKTTMSCATAVHLAKLWKHKQVFLFSTDPAHSLSDCLNLPIGNKPVHVLDNLTAMEIDAQAEFLTLKTLFRKSVQKALWATASNTDLLFDRDVLAKLFELSPPGLDELMALTRAMEFYAQGAYDVFIFDSAPTGHLIRLLELPSLISQWLKLIFGLLLKYQSVLRLPKIAKELVNISKRIKIFRSMLVDPRRTSLMTVAIPTYLAFEETKDLISTCERMNVNTPAMFLNLAAPAGACPQCSMLCSYEATIREKFSAAFPDQHQTIVYRYAGPRGLAALNKLGNALYRPSPAKAGTQTTE